MKITKVKHGSSPIVQFPNPRIDRLNDTIDGFLLGRDLEEPISWAAFDAFLFQVAKAVEVERHQVERLVVVQYVLQRLFTLEKNHLRCWITINRAAVEQRYQTAA